MEFLTVAMTVTGEAWTPPTPRTMTAGDAVSVIVEPSGATLSELRHPPRPKRKRHAIPPSPRRRLKISGIPMTPSGENILLAGQANHLYFAPISRHSGGRCGIRTPHP